ncbi:oxidoreductase [Methylomarinum vadi]|uniref:oxidoreductase n=1 Tax=Methylomarinum vadi TaxID=438855 RepID=UPI00056482F6|nr:oxidoreductase [Methylomarinum vadi]
MTELANELRGLSALLESSFPKKCNVCGREYRTAQQFLQETRDLPSAKSCLKEAVEEDGTAIVEVFRNCICGSTLMDEFNNRRDDTKAGQRKREKFADLLQQLIKQGLDPQVARSELLKVLRGQPSQVLDDLISR